MSEVSELAQIEMVQIKVNSKAISKLKKLEKEDNDRNKTGVSLMIDALSLLNNANGDLKKYKDYSIYKTNESYTLLIERQNSSTILTIDNIDVGNETLSHVKKTNRKYEMRRRNSKALEAYANHPIAVNDPIHDFIKYLFTAAFNRDYVVMNIEQNIVYDHFGTSDNVNLTRVYLLDNDNRLIRIDLSV